MEIGFYSILDFLSRNYKIFSKCIVDDNFKFTNISIYSGESILKRGKIYIVNASQLKSTLNIKERIAIISIGTSNLKGEIHSADYIELAEGIPPYIIIDEIQDFINQRILWKENMYKSLSKDCPIKKLLDLSLPLLENPIYVHDKYYNLISWSDNLEKYGLDDMYNCDEKPEIPIEQILNTSQTEENSPLEYYPQYVGGKNPYVHCNIIVKGVYEGQIFVDERVREICKSDFEILDELRKCIQIAFENYNYLNHFNNKNIKNILKMYLDSDIENLNEFEKSLNNYNISRNSSYVCAKIQLNDLNISYNVLTKESNMLEMKINKSYAFPYNDGIFMLIDSSTYYSKSFINVINEFINKIHAKIGFSRPSNDLADIKKTLLQAEFSLSFGTKHNPHSEKYFFKDYINDYICTTCTKQLSYDMLFPEGLNLLLKYDQENNTNYIEILKIYLQNELSPTKSIQKLYMHKNTFMYKLNKINELINLDYTNSDEKLHYLISLRILELENTKSQSQIL